MGAMRLPAFLHVPVFDLVDYINVLIDEKNQNSSNPFEKLEFIDFYMKSVDATYKSQGKEGLRKKEAS